MSDFDQTSLRDELEVRVIALLTGELSETEADQLEKILANDAELSAFRDQMAELMGELHDGRDELADAVGEPPRQLSEERRAKIFGDSSVLEAKAKRKPIWLNPAVWGVAASIAMVFFISALGTVKFVQTAMREEHVFEAMPIVPPPQKEPEYTVNMEQRNRSTPAPRPPAITVNNPSDLDIPTLNIDVVTDSSSTYGRASGGFGGGGLSGIREMSVSSGERVDGAAQRDRTDSDDFAIDQVETAWLFDFENNIPVDIPKERIEGTPQPIRVPNLEPVPSEAPRMVVQSTLESTSLDLAEKNTEYFSKPESRTITTYTDFGYAGEAKQEAEGREKYKNNVASPNDGDGLGLRVSGIRGVAASSGPVDPFAAPTTGTVPSRALAEKEEFRRDGLDTNGMVDAFAATPGSNSLGEDMGVVLESDVRTLGGVAAYNGKVSSDDQIVLGGSVGGNYANADPFAAASPSKPKRQVSTERRSEVAQLSKDGQDLYLDGNYPVALDASEDISWFDHGSAEAERYAKKLDSIQDGKNSSGDEIVLEDALKFAEGEITIGQLHQVSSGRYRASAAPVYASHMRDKTKDIVIPELNFRDMPLSRAVETLSELSAVYDYDGSGLNIVPILDDSEEDPEITLSLKNVTIGQAVAKLSHAAGYGYDIGPDAIVIGKGFGSSASPRVSNRKSQEIVIPQVNFNGMELSRVVETLRELSKVYDPEQKGIPMEYVPVNGENPRVNISLRNLSLDRVLQFVTQQVGYEAVDVDGEFIRIQSGGKSAIEQVANNRAKNVRQTPKQEKLAAEEPFSTFSLNISDVSFKLAQAALGNSRVPPKAQIRTEEFVNSFDYGDPAPRPNEPVALNWEIAQHPFEHDRQVVRFSLQTQASGRTSGQPLNISLLVDNSGSMQRPDRRAILQNSLQTLEAKLTPQDNLNIVLFARQPRLIAEAQTRASQKAAVESALAYRPEGGTNLEAGLKAAYETAARNFLPNGSNRVIVMTDGAANLGNVNSGELAEYVVEQRKQGIALDAYGIGWDDYNDALLEEITRNGDGRYAFLNSVEEASADFSEKLAGTLRVAASNVKVQIEWNPDRVQRYRQIGYDLHQLKKEDFRDNTVDAAEIGEAESGTALYVMKIDEDPKIIGGLGTLHVRYLDPASGLYKEHSWPLPMPRQIPAAKVASPSMRLAMTSAFFGERLADSPYAGGYGFNDLYTMMSGLPEAFPNQPRVSQMQSMLLQAGELYGENK